MLPFYFIIGSQAVLFVLCICLDEIIQLNIVHLWEHEQLGWHWVEEARNLGNTAAISLPMLRWSYRYHFKGTSTWDRCYGFSATEHLQHFRRFSRSKCTPKYLDFGAKLLWIYCCGFGTDYVNVKKSMYFKFAGMDSNANQQCFCSKIHNFWEPVGGQTRHVKLLHGFKKMSAVQFSSDFSPPS